MEEAICAKGLIKNIILAMGKDAKVARSQSLGCRIIASLSVSPNVRNFLGVCESAVHFLNYKDYPNY
jgi:hypothetical protein